jgi:hypothetical protein
MRAANPTGWNNAVNAWNLMLANPKRLPRAGRRRPGPIALHAQTHGLELGR